MIEKCSKKECSRDTRRSALVCRPVSAFGIGLFSFVGFWLMAPCLSIEQFGIIDVVNLCCLIN